MRSADYWNQKYLQSPVLYDGRALFMNDGIRVTKTVPLAIDVRHFVQVPDFFLERIAKDEGIWTLPSDEDKAFACLEFVKRHVKYVPDKESFGVNEMWQFPNETLSIGVGDCEDGAILIASLMRNAGIPAHRVKVCAGWVVPGPNAPLGGHAYPLFLREKDEEWVALDWCFYPNSQPVNNRVPVKNDPLYKDVWFTFNDERSWSGSPVTVIRSVVTPVAG